jgi:hypothetical protein
MAFRCARQVLTAVALLTAGTTGVMADIIITRAEISAGRLVVAGTRTGTAPRIVLDGRYSTEVGAGGSFAFALVYLPSDCIVKLSADGGTGGEDRAVIANCAPRSLRPRGAWRGGASYAENDLVTDDGSAYRARVSNTGKRPALNDRTWEVIASRGDRGVQGIQGATGARGIDGAPGRDVAVPLLLHGEQRNAEITNAYSFVGPTGEVSVAKDQLVVIDKASVALSMTNPEGDTTAEITFCTKAPSDSEPLPFSKIAESVTLALPHGRSVDYMQDFDLIAADPGTAGTYTVGACMRHKLPDDQALSIASFSVSKACVSAAR